MTYKGYRATVEADEDGVLHGEVRLKRDVVTFQASADSEAQQAFEASVDDYLEFCRSRGEAPDEPALP